MVTFTKEQLVSDIILRVTGGKPSDDLELEPRQVEFWIDQLMPALQKQLLDKKFAEGGMIDASYIKIEDCLDAKIKLLDCIDCQDNIYIDLGCHPIDLHRDLGVIRVVTMDGSWVDKVNLMELDSLRNLKFSRPSLKNLKYHRVRNRLYIHGLTNDTIHLAQFMVAYVPSQSVQELEQDAQVYVGDELLALLATALEEIARRQVYQSDMDMSNNGQQDLKAQ
jgi:hypothetical protein